MSTKLFIQNLPQYITGDKLKSIFLNAGNVIDATIVHDKKTNQPNGTGFIDMNSDAEAQEAIKMFDGKELDGCFIAVRKADSL